MTGVVIDASALLSLLLSNDQRAAILRQSIADADVMAPTILPYQVTNVIRRWESDGRLPHQAAEAACRGLAEFDVELWQWATLADRVWQLRGSITSYDASYVALAEIVNCPLLTADAKLAAMAPPSCQVVLV